MIEFSLGGQNISKLRKLLLQKSIELNIWKINKIKSMSNLRKEFTFKDLTNIACGASTIGPVNLTALHILVLCLLRKRQYEAEIVSIEGIAAVCLRKLLKKCKGPKFTFQYVEPKFKHKFDLLEKLEIRMICLQRNYERHLQDARNCQKYVKYPNTEWSAYSLQTEDLRESDADLGKLLENRLFISVLREKSTNVVLEKLACLEVRIENLREKLEKFRADLSEKDVLKKIDAIIPMCKEIKKLDEIANGNSALLTSSAPEIQDMLNCKVDRVILPSLSNWLKSEFPKTEKVLMDLLNIPVECVSGSIWNQMNKNLCLSCGNNFTSTKNNVLHFRDWNAICSCQPFPKYSNLLEKIKKFRIRTFRLARQFIKCLSKVSIFLERLAPFILQLYASALVNFNGSSQCGNNSFKQLASTPSTMIVSHSQSIRFSKYRNKACNRCKFSLFNCGEPSAIRNNSAIV
uniref:Uncharacterized protein n=1 Tax=Glossina palpalis gambiensis TaxID=67801 RepID=A0A1B0BBT5_9MUSC